MSEDALSLFPFPLSFGSLVSFFFFQGREVLSLYFSFDIRRAFFGARLPAVFPDVHNTSFLLFSPSLEGISTSFRRGGFFPSEDGKRGPPLSLGRGVFGERNFRFPPPLSR